MFDNVYQGRRVLVTGHTGFKGSWLCQWLLSLGAEVFGYSLYIPSDPSLFEVLGLADRMHDHVGDIRDLDSLDKIFRKAEPEIVFHLAAQPIVRISYDDPKVTFDTNLGGTVNVLEAIRTNRFVKAAVLITSDKCYDNVEWEYGYREIDRLGGKDPYSASKASAEIAFKSYYHSFFSATDSTRISTTRAGNVIGGGDWALDRIVPDAVRAWSMNEKVIIRSPQATRPWQHVFEPLSGYLWLGAQLYQDMEGLTGEAFNFGPDVNVVKSVSELLDAMKNIWTGAQWEVNTGSMGQKKESSLLKLSCDKALYHLGWQPTLSFKDTMELTTTWYMEYYKGGSNMNEYAKRQISFYEEKARAGGRSWVR